MKTYRLGTIRDLKQLLLEAPPLPEAERHISKSQVQQILVVGIRRMRRQGYTLDAIVEKLQEGGYGITRHTLSRWLSESKPSTGRKRLRSEQTPAPRKRVKKPVAEVALARSVDAGSGKDPTKGTSGSFVPPADSVDL